MVTISQHVETFARDSQNVLLDRIPLAGDARTCGTCGELVQGQFGSGDDFLVTLPVKIWSHVRVSLDVTTIEITGEQPNKMKTKRAIRRTLDYLGYPSVGAVFKVISDIPEGKGMASSTADIVAACHATAQTTGCSLSPEEISRVAIEIEPSDGVMYPGVVSYNHRRGELIESLGSLPPMDILAVDLGGHVDTLRFNRIPKNYNTEELEILCQAYKLVKTGIREQSLEKIGRAATMSARVNQRLLLKPQLEALIEISTEYGAHGVCVAHSGTVAGLLFERGANGLFEHAKDELWRRIDRTLVIYALQSLD
jgi:L-threonine kinase